MLPNFIVIGAPRAGSTALCHHLDQHPEIFMTSPKETFFFSHQRLYNSTEGWKWYTSLFDLVTPQHRAIGEGTTDYSNPARLDTVVPRLKEHVPRCRFIYIVRHPIRRIESSWKLRHASGTVSDINSVVCSDPYLIGASSYWKVLNSYLKSFDREQIHIVFNEDYRADQPAELAKCFRFLGVDDRFVVPPEIRNPSDKLRRRPSWMKAFKRSQTLRRLYYRAMPASLRNSLFQALTQKSDNTIIWEPSTLEWVVEQLRADSEQFLVSCGRSADFWKLDNEMNEPSNSEIRTAE